MIDTCEKAKYWLCPQCQRTFPRLHRFKGHHLTAHNCASTADPRRIYRSLHLHGPSTPSVNGIESSSGTCKHADENLVCAFRKYALGCALCLKCYWGDNALSSFIYHHIEHCTNGATADQQSTTIQVHSLLTQPHVAGLWHDTCFQMIGSYDLSLLRQNLSWSRPAVDPFIELLELPTDTEDLRHQLPLLFELGRSHHLARAANDQWSTAESHDVLHRTSRVPASTTHTISGLMSQSDHELRSRREQPVYSSTDSTATDSGYRPLVSSSDMTTEQIDSTLATSVTHYGGGFSYDVDPKAYTSYAISPIPPPPFPVAPVSPGTSILGSTGSQFAPGVSVGGYSSGGNELFYLDNSLGYTQSLDDAGMPAHEAYHAWKKHTIQPMSAPSDSEPNPSVSDALSPLSNAMPPIMHHIGHKRSLSDKIKETGKRGLKSIIGRHS